EDRAMSCSGLLFSGAKASFDPLSRQSIPEGMSFGDGQMPSLPNDFSGELPSFGDETSESTEGESGNKRPSFNGFGGMGMGSSDVKLKYTDDDPDSYSNIFNNAKSTVTEFDKARLINALKNLSEGENLEDTLDIDEVLRYFVVHNYLVNSDSYTGSMIHNYYLHEADGKLSMIPWDYNLAFGTFQGSSDGTDAVNDPIDTPLSITGDGSRPMADWIFRNEEYTELYHQYFAEFLEQEDIIGLIDETYEMIKSYVEKDPTAFCTYEEFETGVATLRSFCEKRTESIKGQLDGSIPSTDEGQQAESANFIDASDIKLSDMGSMGGGNGGFGGSRDRNTDDNTETNEQGGFGGFGGGQMPSGEMPSDFGGQMPGGFERPDSTSSGPSVGNRPQGGPGQFGGSFGGSDSSSASQISIDWPPVIISAVVLAAGLAIAILYKKRS
ncbi:MAG: CotH kinase family protein, partial [Firmicutes bacterium]|nr:CotH kinase family protein [Bacillota bacterium]